MLTTPDFICKNGGGAWESKSTAKSIFLNNFKHVFLELVTVFCDLFVFIIFILGYHMVAVLFTRVCAVTICHHLIVVIFAGISVRHNLLTGKEISHPFTIKPKPANRIHITDLRFLPFFR